MASLRWDRLEGSFRVRSDAQMSSFFFEKGIFYSKEQPDEQSVEQ